MGFFNILWARKKQCPRCHRESDWEIEFKFGIVEQFEYEMGDELPWTGHRPSTPVQKPAADAYCAEGYATCSICNKDFCVSIVLENNIFKQVYWDILKKGYTEVQR